VAKTRAVDGGREVPPRPQIDIKTTKLRATTSWSQYQTGAAGTVHFQPGGHFIGHWS